MNKTDFFAPIALIIGWIKRGEFGFKGFTIPDLATAIEIADVLHVDRFGRLKKAPDEVKNAFLDRLADYFEESTCLKTIPEELRLIAEKGDHEAFKQKTRELIIEQFAKAQIPIGSEAIGWMYESLPLVREIAKSATVIPETPAERKERIRATVDDMAAKGMTKTKAFKAVANRESLSPYRIKQLYYPPSG